MPYVPPHKRHSRDAGAPAPSPESLAPQFRHSLNLGPHRGRTDPRQQQGGGKVFYAPGSLNLWWPVGSPADPIPATFRLDPVPCERAGSEPQLVLVGSRDEGRSEGGGADDKRLREAIAERIEAPLLASLQRAREEATYEGVELKLSFIARVGKVRFDGNASLDTLKRAAAAAELDSRNKVHKSFWTDVPKAYMEEIQQTVVPKLGLHFESEKEHYHVKVFDKSRPDVTISCKCMVTGDGSALKLHKIEMNHVRHLVVDLSCLYKDLDFRFILVNKRRLAVPNDEEKDDIDNLIKSAILDPDVKGGLRWPLGKDSVAERYNLVGVWHTKYKAYRGPAVRLKLRNADRFDHMTSTGEVSDEVTLKLTGISNKLREGDLETEPLTEMVGEAVKLIWDHFLSYNNHQFP